MIRLISVIYYKMHHILKGFNNWSNCLETFCEEAEQNCRILAYLTIFSKKYWAYSRSPRPLTFCDALCGTLVASPNEAPQGTGFGLAMRC